MRQLPARSTVATRYLRTGLVDAHRANTSVDRRNGSNTIVISAWNIENQQPDARLLFAMRMTHALVVFLTLHLIALSEAIRGQQRPNTFISLPTPKVTSRPISSDTFIYCKHADSRSKDGESGPPGCNCQLLRRTKHNTPPECPDYCIWRWAWY